MATYPFLSDEWMDAARDLREEYRGKVQPMPQQLRMNQVITDVPFGTGVVEAHMDSTTGELEMDLGHMDSADVTVTLDYATARAMFVDQNPQVAMQAFMSGKIKVQGDMSKLLALQNTTPDPVAIELAVRIQQITG